MQVYEFNPTAYDITFPDFDEATLAQAEYEGRDLHHEYIIDQGDNIIASTGPLSTRDRTILRAYLDMTAEDLRHETRWKPTTLEGYISVFQDIARRLLRDGQNSQTPTPYPARTIVGGGA
jgi:hypothetical protein